MPSAGGQFVFRPGEANPSGGVYASWAALVADAALVAGEKSVLFDDTLQSPCVIPPGTWDLGSPTTLVAGGNRTASPVPVTVSDGAVLRNVFGFDSVAIRGEATSGAAVPAPDADASFHFRGGASVTQAGVGGAFLGNAHAGRAVTLLLHDKARLQAAAGGWAYRQTAAGAALRVVAQDDSAVAPDCLAGVAGSGASALQVDAAASVARAQADLPGGHIPVEAADLGRTAWSATLAGLAAAPGPNARTFLHVDEVDARYEFVVGDATEPDGWTALAPTGGTAGRWLLRSPRISIAPLGGGADDWPRLIAGACRALSKVGGAVHMRPGTWHCKTLQSLPNGGIELHAGDEVLVVSSLVADGTPNQAPFLALAGNISLSTTVAADNQVGSRQVSSAAAVAPGSLVRIRDAHSGSGFQGSTYTVRAVAGTGPHVLTLDRPVLYRFRAGDPLEVMPEIPTRIRIHGNGMRVTGTGSRLLEFLGARHCLVADVRFVPEGGMTRDLVASFDVLGYDNEFRHCEVDGGGLGLVGLALETQERSRITGGSMAHHCTGGGFTLYDCVNCLVEDSLSWANGTGLSVTADGNVVGCRDTVVRGGAFNGNADAGIGVHLGSTNTRIEGASARHNGTNVFVGDPGSVVDGTLVSGRFDHGSVAGVTVAGTARRTRLRNVDVSNSAVGANLGAGADVEIDGLVFEGATGPLPNGRAIVSAADRVTARGMRVAPTTVTNAVFVAAGRFSWLDGTITAAAGSNLFRVTGGRLVLSNTVASVAGGTGISTNPGTSVRLGLAVDLSGCAIPVGGAGARNVGTVTLNGSTPVSVPFPDITAQDAVILALRQAGGTQGPAPAVAVTPGVGFAVTGAALDQSTYAYKVA